jgi:hypothetical protein
VNPRTDLWQAIANAVILGLIIAFASPACAAWLAGTGLALSLALNVGYAHALGKRGRSARRIQGDHFLAAHIAGGLALPLIAALATAATGVAPRAAFWGFRHSEIEALLNAAGALILIVFLSSLVDWYYIRPRIDGVVCAPACQANRDEKGPWKRVTRRWYIHRGLATLGYILFAIAVALIVMIMLVRENPAVAGVIGGVSGIAGLLLIFAGPYRDELPTVAKWALSPAFVLGDDLTYEGRGRPKRGYVLHVAVPVVKLVPLDEHGHPTRAAYIEPKNTVLAEGELEPQPAIACTNGCAVLNPECLRQPGERGRRLDRRRRLVIL